MRVKVLPVPTEAQWKHLVEVIARYGCPRCKGTGSTDKGVKCVLCHGDGKALSWLNEVLRS